MINRNHGYGAKREELVYNQIKYNFTEKFDISLPIDKWSVFIKKVNTFVKDNKILLLIFLGIWEMVICIAILKYILIQKRIVLTSQNLFMI